jgi:hypothetical protein
MTVVLALGLLVLVARLLVTLHERPQRGVLLLVALAPFNGLLLIAGLPEVVRGWKEALVLLVVAASLAPGPGRRRVAARSVPPWLWWGASLIALAAASAVVAGLPRGAVGLKVAVFYSLLVIPLLRTPLTARDRTD